VVGPYAQPESISAATAEHRKNVKLPNILHEANLKEAGNSWREKNRIANSTLDNGGTNR